MGLAGILFSIIGSIAGLALGIGTMIANDIGRGLLRITSEHTVPLVNRVSVVAVTCLAVLIAITNADIYVLD